MIWICDKFYLMSTIRQKKLAKAIIENFKEKRPKNKADLSVSVGFSPTTAYDQQARIFRSKGVQKELIALGFNEESAKQIVKEIMIDPTVDSSSRLKATDQVFKVVGSYSPEKVVVASIDIPKNKKEELNKILFNK